MKRLFGAVIAMLMALLLLASCNGGIGNLLIPVKSVAISESTLEMIIGDQKALDVIVSPSDASNRKVTWSSSKPEVANVNSQGVVEALSVGMTIITAETVDGGYKARCEVEVRDNKKESVVTGDASHISCNAALLSGQAILPQETGIDLEFGVLYSTNPAVRPAGACVVSENKS